MIFRNAFLQNLGVTISNLDFGVLCNNFIVFDDLFKIFDSNPKRYLSLILLCILFPLAGIAPTVYLTLCTKRKNII